jgi:hypothetical protein
MSNNDRPDRVIKAIQALSSTAIALVMLFTVGSKLFQQQQIDSPVSKRIEKLFSNDSYIAEIIIANGRTVYHGQERATGEEVFTKACSVNDFDTETQFICISKSNHIVYSITWRKDSPNLLIVSVSLHGQNIRTVVLRKK